MVLRFLVFVFTDTSFTVAIGCKCVLSGRYGCSGLAGVCVNLHTHVGHSSVLCPKAQNSALWCDHAEPAS